MNTSVTEVTLQNYDGEFRTPKVVLHSDSLVYIWEMVATKSIWKLKWHLQMYECFSII